MSVKRTTRFRFSLLSILFLILIFLPALNHLFRFYEPGVLREKRRRVTFPRFERFDLKGYMDQWTEYFERTSDFRSLFVFVNSWIKVKWFGVSPVDRVMLGKDRWLYIKKLRENNREVDYSRSIDPFSKDELAFWGRIFEERRLWLKKRGIMMLVVIVPNKSTIYPEFLPDRVRRMTGQGRTNQLVRYFRRFTGISLIDLRAPLLRAKAAGQIYYRTDSHWNWAGAYIGYREIMRYLARFFPRVRVRAYRFFRLKRMAFPPGGDLAVMLSLQNSLYKESFSRLFPGSGIHIVKKKLKGFLRKNVDVQISVCREGLLPKTVMIHDSFGNRLRRMLSVNFSEIIYMRDWGFNFFPGVIERERPKIVIYEIAERFLHNFSLVNPETVIREVSQLPERSFIDPDMKK